ncbi:MAG TPA: phage portal protein [Anaerohalosphaeraceae bacterium]|nr:phage portal protein [Anaerohalosphaeraceae bacterium]
MKLFKSIERLFSRTKSSTSFARLLRSSFRDPVLAGEPYRQVDIVFACVNKILTTLTARNVPLVLSTIDDQIVEDGPIYDYLFRNPAMSFDRLAADWLGNYILFCDVFFVFDDPIREDSPFEIVAGPRMREIVNPGGTLVGWEWIDDFGRIRRVAPSQVYQTRNFNPYNRWHGLGPLGPCDNALQYCYALILRNRTALRNGAEPGVILQTPAGVKLEPEEITEILSAFDSRYAGEDKVLSTVLLTGGIEAKTLTLKMVDLQAAEIDQKQACRIAAAFNVPPQLIGLVPESQYSGGPAMRDFVFNSCMPLSQLFAWTLTDALISRFYRSQVHSRSVLESGTWRHLRNLSQKESYRLCRIKAAQSGRPVFAWFDWDQHPVVAETRMDWTKKVIELSRDGIPLEQIIRAYDLPFDLEAMPHAKYWWINWMSLAPAQWVLEAGPQGIAATGPAYTPEEEPQKQTVRSADPAEELVRKEQADRLWKDYVQSWLPLEKEMQAALRSFFLRQRRELTSRLQEALSGKKDDPQSPPTTEILARVVLDLKKENGRLQLINRTFFERAARIGAEGLLKSSGLSAEEAARRAESACQRQMVRGALLHSSRNITGINQTTQAAVSRTLREGLEAGEGLGELTNRLRSVLDGSLARAQRIARTQVAGAVSTGRFAGMQEAGIEKKSWLTARDEAVRDAHRRAEEMYRDGIPLNQPFLVNGEPLMYPGDPSGSAGNIINCRCVLMALYGRSQSIGDSHAV